MNIYFVLLFIYVTVCLYYIVTYYKKDNGVFQAPFLFSLASVLMFTPQFSSIILSSYYDSDILYILSYVMITGMVGFAYGFEKAQKKKIVKLRDLDLNKSETLFFLFFIVGTYAQYKNSGVWMNTLSGADRTQFIIYVNLATFFDLAFLYAAVKVIREKKVSLRTGIILVVCCLFYFNTIVLLARRAVAVKLIVTLLFLLANYVPKIEKKIKLLVCLFFVIGSIGSSSIGDIRSNLSGNNESEFDYLQNFKSSFHQQDFSFGMDLGNGAKAIDYCFQNSSYDLGLPVWNDFVQLYVPRFVVGERFKESLKFTFEHSKYAASLTCGITTLTGFYEAFAAFSFFSFLMFILVGWVLGQIWKRSSCSNMYMLLYLLLMSQIPNLASHGFGYIWGRLELFYIFIFPLIFGYTCVRRIRKARIL